MTISTRILEAVVALMLAAMLAILISILVGCGEQTYRIAHVEGTGAIVVERCALDEDGALSDCAGVLDTAWSSAGETVEGDAGLELVHCARLERLVAMGLDLQFLAGVIPGVSDERCEGSRSRPFR